jgi:hypothetical protein
MPVLIIGIAVIVAFGYIAQFTTNNASIAVTGVLLAAFVFVFLLKREEKRKQEVAELKKLEEEQKIIDAEIKIREEVIKKKQFNEQLMKTLSGYATQAISSLENIAIRYQSAEESLDTAEQNYKEGVFAPFWDAVERAVNEMAEINSLVMTIKSAADAYADKIVHCSEPCIPFPVSSSAINKIGSLRETEVRLRKIVRQAQANFQFASIYEQRKTNELIAGGFRDLQDAIYNIGSSIAFSVNDLQYGVDRISDLISSGNSDISDSLDEINATFSSSTKSMLRIEGDFRLFAVENSRKQEKVLSMLDNIQRRRKPLY